MSTDDASDVRASEGRVPQLALWSLAWVLSLAVARFGPGGLWDSRDLLSGAAIAVNLALGAGWVLAYRRHLGALDELQRKIEMDAMVFTLGAGIVVGFAVGAAEASGLIGLEPDVAAMALMMGPTYMLATLAGRLRYR